MLALKIKEGSFLMIGDAVVRIDHVKTESNKVKVGVFAPDAMRICRFDRHGKLEGAHLFTREEIERLERRVAQVFPVGAVAWPN